jgi:hypothetical protein
MSVTRIRHCIYENKYLGTRGCRGALSRPATHPTFTCRHLVAPFIGAVSSYRADTLANGNPATTQVIPRRTK